MTLGELAASKAEQWGLGDDYVTIVRLSKHIIGARATIIQRRYDQTKRFPSSLIMTVRDIDFCQVEKAECICLIDGKKAVRTVNKVPKPLLVKDDTTFTFVGAGNQEESFSYITPEDVQLAQHRRFSSKKIMYTYMNDYIYIINSPAFKEGAMRYVPENPLELLEFGRCDSSDCIEDDDLIIEGSLEDGIDSLLEKKRPQIIKEHEVEIND